MKRGQDGIADEGVGLGGYVLTCALGAAGAGVFEAVAGLFGAVVVRHCVGRLAVVGRGEGGWGKRERVDVGRR